MRRNPRPERGRRLIEPGVTVAAVRVTGWDGHHQIADGMRPKDPRYNSAVAALVEDLHARGLASGLLVVAMGEFGRTLRAEHVLTTVHLPSSITGSSSGS
jgi:uncharacterized protein (DUF1501 family)